MGERRKEERRRDRKRERERKEGEKATHLGDGEKMIEIIIPKFCFSQGPT